MVHFQKYWLLGGNSITKLILKEHVASVHKGIKPFICDICEIDFSAKKTLKQHHILKHTNERTLACALCTSTFKLKNSLNRHVKEVHRGLVEQSE